MDIFSETRATASFRLDGEKYTLVPSEMTKSANSYSRVIKNILAVLDVYPVSRGMCRWVVRLENIGGTRSGRITELFGADITFPVTGDAVWESIHGDTCGENTFMPDSEILCDGGRIFRSAEGGRSSQGNAFPYFDVTSDSGCALFALGWTGQWEYSLTRDGGAAHLCAGFTDCDMFLEPGEKIRSVGVIACSPNADCELPAEREALVLYTRQYFRREFREKLSPKARCDGDFVIPVSLQVFDRYFWTDKSWATEEGQLHCIECAKKLPDIDTYWLDAAWFKDGFPNGVGNYDFDCGFPRGLSAVSRAAKEGGMRFMLWFEPERCHSGSDAVKYRREYLIPLKDENGAERDDYIYDLTNEEAYAWLRDTLVRMIRENGIDIYRQDFNIDPLPYWRGRDTDGRRGITENKYITNLYRLWDALLAEFPGLIIDNCSSGGRRLDFEMNMRGVPMWRSDTGCFPPSEKTPTHIWNQNQTLTLTRYLPYHATATWCAETYPFRSAETMGLALNLDVMSDDFDITCVKDRLHELIELRGLCDGDFFPLTPPSNDESSWCAYRFDKEGREGFCVFFRRAENGESEREFRLRGIDPSMKYETETTDDGFCVTRRTLDGKELASLTVNLPRPGTSCVVKYKMIPKD